MAVRFPVTFEPAGVTVWVADGESVLKAAQRGGVVIPAPCGGRGTCGKCAVRVLSGEPSPPDEIERESLRNAPSGVRLACRMQVSGPLTVRPIVVRTVMRRGEDNGASEPLAAGIDLGTTTVSAIIVGLESGLELGRASVPNRQQSFGMDVLSRISTALSGESDALAQAAHASIADALQAACGRAGACVDEIEHVDIAGNTAMIALLVGSDVNGLAAAPFEAPSGIDGRIELSGACDCVAESASVEAVPHIGGFVGGDVTAGLIAAGMLSTDEDFVYVDVGTNAEVVVRRKGAYTYCSAPAGPAFEGFGITDGGVLAPGAITYVALDGDEVKIRTHENAEPTWLTGPGVVSSIATLRRAGHLDASGLMSADGPLEDRFDTDTSGVVRFRLGEGSDGPHLTQLDVRAVQTAKAAVATAVWFASAQARLKARHLDRAFITGAFGAALHIEDIVDLGIVPEEIAAHAAVVADAALLGASAAALDPSVSADIDRLRARATHLELAGLPGFNDIFLRATKLEPFGMKKGPE